MHQAPVIDWSLGNVTVPPAPSRGGGEGASRSDVRGVSRWRCYGAWGRHGRDVTAGTSRRGRHGGASRPLTGRRARCLCHDDCQCRMGLLPPPHPPHQSPLSPPLPSRRRGLASPELPLLSVAIVTSSRRSPGPGEDSAVTGRHW